MAGWVDGDLKQRHEDVLQHLLEAGQLLLGVVDITGKRGAENPFFNYNNRAIWHLVQTYSNGKGQKS